MSTRDISWAGVVNVADAWGWKSCDFFKELSGNLGASNCRSPKALSRAVYGLFAYTILDFIFNIINSMNEVW